MSIVRVPISGKFELALDILDGRQLLLRKLDVNCVNVFNRSLGVAGTGDGNDLSNKIVISALKQIGRGNDRSADLVGHLEQPCERDLTRRHSFLLADLVLSTSQARNSAASLFVRPS